MPKTTTSLLRLSKKKRYGYKSDKEQFKIGSLALKLGHSITKLQANCWNAMGEWQERRKHLREPLTSTKYMQPNGMTIFISTYCRNINEAKWNAPLILPFTEDIQTLYSYFDWKSSDQNSRNTQAQSPQLKTDHILQICLAEVVLSTGEVKMRFPLCRSRPFFQGIHRCHMNTQIGLYQKLRRSCVVIL